MITLGSPMMSAKGWSKMTRSLLNLSWSKLADDWSRMFYDLIAESASTPIPMWRSA